MRFISIGGDCQVAHQVRRLRPNDYEKHFFDWMVCPLTSATRLIEERFEHLLHEEDLVADLNASSPHPYKVVDSFNDIWLLHDYEVFDKENVIRVKAKYNYLAEKFNSLLQNDDRNCFIRVYHKHDKEAGHLEARKLLSVLQGRNPSSRLLYLHQNVDSSDVIDGAFRSTYAPATPGHWQGDDLAWSRILLEFMDDVN